MGGDTKGCDSIINSPRCTAFIGSDFSPMPVSPFFTHIFRFQAFWPAKSADGPFSGIGFSFFTNHLYR